MSLSFVETKPDGLHVAAAASLRHLLADELFWNFADGLLSRVAAATLPDSGLDYPLCDLLYHQDTAYNGFLAALLALDAEVIATVNAERSVWPLPGFLSYRTQLAEHPLDAVRLPPLNPDGHYLFTAIHGKTLIVRFDIHLDLRIMGHVRIAIGGTAIKPSRLQLIEHRLERTQLTGQLLAEIETAGITGGFEADSDLFKQLMSLLREFAGQ